MVKPGQTRRQALDAQSFDVLLDFVYFLLAEHKDEEGLAALDAELGPAVRLDTRTPKRMIEMTRADGTKVKVTQERYDQIQINSGRPWWMDEDGGSE